MDSSGMDFTVRHPDHHHHHHHPHYDHTNGASSSASASRCPAFRAAAEQSNYHRPSLSPARGSGQYESSHRNLWQSRSPQHWRPAMIAPYAQDSLVMGTFSAPTASNQSAQSQQPLCPMPVNSNGPPNVSEPYPSQIAALQQFRPTMHPAPRLLGQPYQGFGNLNASQSNTQHPSNRSVHRTNAGYAGLPASGPMHPVPPLHNPASRPSANPIQISQTAPFTNENRNPSQQLPNLPQMFTSQNPSTPLSRQTPEPVTQATGPVEDGSSRPASQSPSGPASTAPHRSNDQPSRVINPVEIRRASTAAIGRARRSMQRYTAAPSEWLGENGVLLRRDMSMMEFAESFPGAISDGEGAMSGRFLRGHCSGKRVASKKALASLQSVNIADLPESERTCVICYNEFGVANPEGINEAPLRLPKCKHVFGDHCIKKWFQESDSCPYCRDKVHSEPQQMPPRRSYHGFRFIPPYPITAQHLPGYQGHEQNQSRDRDAPELEPSTQPAHSMASSTTDRLPSQFSSIGSMNQSSSSSRRFENSHTHGMRIMPWNAALERHSPPVEYDRRRRTRHRVRVSPPSTRPSEFGGPTSNGASQTSVRSSRSSRSRSPVEYASFGMDLSNRRSLTNSPEQRYWNDSSSNNSSQSGGATRSSPSSGSVLDITNYHVQPQIVHFPEDAFLNRTISANEIATIQGNEHSSGLPQMHPSLRFSSPPSGSLGSYVPISGHLGSNQFTSYQQS
ncbi:hypothetical protein F4859DRAFT_501705 [Xylaria cf. heliscus]|nr:hypothetical protein F4859DRAFT_501705 [Xylaria cf. heliscus]